MGLNPPQPIAHEKIPPTQPYPKNQWVNPLCTAPLLWCTRSYPPLRAPSDEDVMCGRDIPLATTTTGATTISSHRTRPHPPHRSSNHGGDGCRVPSSTARRREVNGMAGVPRRCGASSMVVPTRSTVHTSLLERYGECCVWEKTGRLLQIEFCVCICPSASKSCGHGQ